MRAPVRFTAVLASAFVGCASQQKPAEPQPQPAGSAKSAAGAVVPFRFEPDAQKPWGLRVERHRTLPPPPGSDGPALHLDTEEESRLWSQRLPDGNWVMDEVLTRHAETRNGDNDDDPVMIALTGVTVGMEIGTDGKWKNAVEPGTVIKQIAQHWPGGDNEFQNLPPEVFTKELERDWKLGAQIYFDEPVRVGEPVFSLMSVSLPQLQTKYVAVDERFEAPVTQDGVPQVTSTQAMFGRGDPRWAAVKQKLGPLMQQLGLADDDVLTDFDGKGGETVGLTSLQVFRSSYEGQGIFPLVTPRGTYPLRFEVEEVAGAIAPPPMPTDPRHTAMLEPDRSSARRR